MRQKHSLFGYFCVTALFCLPFCIPCTGREILRKCWMNLVCHHPSKKYRADHTFKAKQLVDLQSPQVSYQGGPIDAQIIYRPFHTWTEYFWVNVGTEHTKTAPEDKIGVGSIVLESGTIVGVVEKSYKFYSQVRLISSSALPISVQAIKLDTNHPSYESIRQKMDHTPYLKIGEISGTKSKTNSSILKGSRFTVLSENRKNGMTNPESSCPTIGELLVTTGLDGLCPKGIPVGWITHVFPKEESDPFCEIEAMSTTHSLDRLEKVTILPPIRGAFTDRNT